MKFLPFSFPSEGELVSLRERAIFGDGEVLRLSAEARIQSILGNENSMEAVRNANYKNGKSLN